MLGRTDRRRQSARGPSDWRRPSVHSSRSRERAYRSVRFSVTRAR